MIQIVHIPGLQYDGETMEQAAERERQTIEANRRLLEEWKEGERQRAAPMRSMQKWAEERGIIRHNADLTSAWFSLERPMNSDTPTTDAATHDDWSGGAAAVELEVAQDMERLARSLMRTCYDEANRLANHGSNGLEKLVMTQLYDAANAAKVRLNASVMARPDGGPNT